MELNKNIELVSLYEMYGNLLTAKQKQVFEMSVLKDLSLSEISEILKISRQAVKFSLDNSIVMLEKIESQLQILSKFAKIKEKLNYIKDNVEDSLKTKITEILEEM